MRMKKQNWIVIRRCSSAKGILLLELAIRYGTRYNASAGTDLCVPLVLEYSLTDRPSRATNASIQTNCR